MRTGDGTEIKASSHHHDVDTALDDCSAELRRDDVKAVVRFVGGDVFTLLRRRLGWFLSHRRAAPALNGFLQLA